ncbi:hypothetical protein PM082_009090 [Marasmius tenuissimus]|nr:hypothetical protein PM082_009090 [Marasmius tenuissimus]
MSIYQKRLEAHLVSAFRPSNAIILYQVTLLRTAIRRIYELKNESEGKRCNGRSSGLGEGSRIKCMELFEIVGSQRMKTRTKSRMLTEAPGMGTR